MSTIETNGNTANTSHVQDHSESLKETVAMCALLIVVIAGLALLLTGVTYQASLLAGRGTGPMLPITLTAACILGTVTLVCALQQSRKSGKLILLLLTATMITVIALAACCYRGVLSMKIFAKATLLTLGSPLALGWWLNPCACFHRGA